MKLIKGDFSTRLELQLAPGIRAGFPSPAEDYLADSIGLAPNKTLAKIASKLAKKFEVYRHCCIIDTDEKREAALKWLPIEDVWASVVDMLSDCMPWDVRRLTTLPTSARLRLSESRVKHV